QAHPDSRELHSFVTDSRTGVLWDEIQIVAGDPCQGKADLAEVMLGGTLGCSLIAHFVDPAAGDPPQRKDRGTRGRVFLETARFMRLTRCSFLPCCRAWGLF